MHRQGRVCAHAIVMLFLSIVLSTTRVYAEDAQTTQPPTPSPTAQIGEKDTGASMGADEAEDVPVIEESTGNTSALVESSVPTSSTEPANMPQLSASANSTQSEIDTPETSESNGEANVPSNAQDNERQDEELIEVRPSIAAFSRVASASQPAATEATFETGEKFNCAIKSLVTSESVTSFSIKDTSIIAFKRSETQPDDSRTTIDISDDQDGSITAWFDTTSGTLYWYSSAQNVYLNADCYGMFAEFTALKDVRLNAVSTGRVENMGAMFFDCSSLEELDLQEVSTSNVTNMLMLFSGCKSLEKIDVSTFDTANVKTMYMMFSDCEKLKEINLSTFTTQSCTDGFGAMFRNCKQLEKVDMQNFDFSVVSYSDAGPMAFAPMFNGCENLNAIVLGPKCIFGVATNSFISSSFGSGGPTRPNTASGLPSNGKWGRGSETASWQMDFSAFMSDWFMKNKDNLFDLTGTWYAQAESGAIFDANGGEGDMPGEPYIADTEQSLSPNQFVREGYHFVRWNTAEDGSGESYEDGAILSLKAPITLYAQWEKDAPKEYEPSKVEVLYTGGTGYGIVRLAGAGIVALAVLMLIAHKRG